MRWPACLASLLCGWALVASAQPASAPLPAQPDQALQAQALINQVQRHLNLCMQQAAADDVARLKLQQEIDTLKQQLAEKAKVAQGEPAPSGEAQR